MVERFAKVSAAGSVLFREGEDSDTMYVVQSGKIALSKATEGGAPRIIGIVGAGEFLGELSVLTGTPRSTTATVVEDVRLLAFDGRMFESMVVGSTEIAVRLIKRLAQRLHSAEVLIDILLHRDPKVRVILALEREVEMSGKQQDDGSILVPYAAETFAQQLGLEADQVLAVVSRLARLNVATPNSEGLLIPNVARLREFLEFVRDRESASWN